MFYNVGFNSGKYGYKASHKLPSGIWRSERSYTIWHSMLKRCYSGELRSYDDEEVCSLWRDYQEFAKWYENQPEHRKGKNWQLGKDILNFDKRVYSPENCQLVPVQVNVLLRRMNDRGFPIGVSYHKRDNMYRAYLKSVDGKTIEKCGFKTELEAFLWYKENKENVIKQVAEKYKSVVDIDVYLALLNFKVEDVRYNYDHVY